MIQSVTNDQLNDMESAGRKAAEGINALIDTEGIRNLIESKKVRFCANPHGYVGRPECRAAYVAWGPYALQDLVRQMNTDAKLRFRHGNLGSVWFDTNLTGGPGGATKKTRVALNPNPAADGSWEVMLDATFDETW